MKMQNTESNYLIKLKIAIDKAKQMYTGNMAKAANFEYLMGWNEAIGDLSYASECGELASRQHVDSWIDPSLDIQDQEELGYFSCINYIHNEMNKGSSQ